MEFPRSEKAPLFEEDEYITFDAADTRSPEDRILALEQELLFAGREDKKELMERIAAIRATLN